METYLNNLFSSAAAEEEKKSKGKAFKYCLYPSVSDRMANENALTGICVINSCSYDRSIDCNVYSFTDMETGKAYRANQFVVIFTERG